MEDETRLGVDATHMAPATPSHANPTLNSGTGWLSSSGSLDHGRFTPGTVLASRYRIIALLGKGGMGEVYRADDLRLGQAVALKFLPPALAHDAQRLAQFHNEVRTARQVSHPNVCRVYDIGEMDPSTGSGQAGQLFLTMEYVDGEDLSASLKRVGRFPEERAIEIARQICAGLAAAHERGVLHRDLKPANIMLDSEGRARLMDFGLASIGAVDEIRAGTPAYMAPEQIEGREVTVKSDIFALGLVLYELFTGKRAFQAKTLADLIEQQTSGRITPPSAIVPSFNPAIERAILRCVDRDPALRPSTALQVAASLPGGDPLAAALAAGETPSPEMVAAAGSNAATLSPLLGYGGIALVAILLGISAFASDRTNLLARVPLDKPAPVLADRADTIRRNFGYTTKPVDTAQAFDTDTDYLSWAANHGAGRAHWPLLGTGRPAVLYFWYRAAPKVLIPVNVADSVTAEDPPLTSTSGDVEVTVDTMGRLLNFSATPPEIDKAPPSPSTTDWSVLFAAAGLDQSKFIDAVPRHVPLTFADERRAWTGSFVEAPELPIRVEAAAYRGRLVAVDVLGPWSQPARDVIRSDRSSVDTIAELVLIGLLIALILGAAIQAQRNLRAGRGDRTGATRTAAFTLIALVVHWIILPGGLVNDAQSALSMMLTFLAVCLLVAALTYLMYLALEPAIRRYWPNVLVTWTRVISGRIRDPLVGRDLFVGTLLAVAMAATVTGLSLLPSALGLPEPTPASAPEPMLLGVRAALGIALNTVVNGLVLTLPLALLVTALRRAEALTVGRLMQKISSGRTPWMPRSVLRVLNMPWLSTLFVGLLLMAVNGVNVGIPWLGVALRAVAGFGALFVLLRFGLFASMAMITAARIMHVAPLTFDHTRMYAPQAMLVAVLILGMMVAGYWMARGSASPSPSRA